MITAECCEVRGRKVILIKDRQNWLVWYQGKTIIFADNVEGACETFGGIANRIIRESKEFEDKIFGEMRPS